MRCYYELLGVPQNVEQVDLKKAYYKLSLQWHPDKNTTEDTTVIFQEIQEAYKVLSDPQERAWYDKHRAQILLGNGRDTQMGGTSDYQESRVDVFQYFTRSCFEKFDDDVKGFYTVYAKVFADITKEEKEAASFSGYTISSSESSSDDENNHGRVSGRISRNYPSFGNSSSSYKKVVAPFYLFWEIFETKKTYTWVEKYDTRLADSRQERRAMEAENNRLRLAAIRKRNEEIRQLVAYVKKRDKRVIAENERIQHAIKEAQARTQLLAAKARQREAALLDEAWNDEIAYGGIGSQWSEQFEAELKRLEAELDGMNVDDSVQNCSTMDYNRTTNHHHHPNNSVNHTNDALNPDETTEQLDNLTTTDHEEEIDEQLYCVACDKLFSSIKAKLNHELSKKHKKQLEFLRKIITDQDDAHFNSILLNEESVNTTENNSSVVGVENQQLNNNNKLTKRAKKAERKRKKEAELQQQSSNSNINNNNNTINEQENATNDLNTQMNNDHVDMVNNDINGSSGSSVVKENTDPTISLSTLNNVNTPTITDHDKKSSSSTQPNQQSVNRVIKQVDKIQSNPIICDTCSKEFESRNALFAHLKESGHAKLKLKSQLDDNVKKSKERKKSKR
ncbi:unnamed protein product [Schistosoma turkestanicum]|nr:unnamed protein product [Schistosoma turkestanicum]